MHEFLSPYVYVGYYCNNNCIFCSESDESYLRSIGGPIDQDKIKAEIKEIRTAYDLITFMGREPTMRKDIVQLIGYAKSLGFKHIGITTNGRMLSYEPYAKAILGSGVTQIGMSFYSDIPEHYDDQAQVKGGYQQAVEALKNIMRLKNNDLSVLLNIPLNNKNKDDLERTVKFLIGMGVKEINILWISPLSQKSRTTEIVGKMSELGNYAAEVAVKYGNQAKFWLNEFAPCALKKEYRDLFFNCLEKNPAKKRIPLCDSCPYAQKCDGIISDYFDLYGTEEFNLD